MDWTVGVATAPTGDELFEVAAKYLKVETRVRRGDRTVQ
jgi:hypothetical protein